MQPATRIYDGIITDSRRWARLAARSDDIFVCTPPKSGTTWTQGICALLIFGDPDVDAGVSIRSPWIDNSMRDIDEMLARLEAQTHRRYLKSHTPLDGIPFFEDATYLAIYRHPIDVHFSMRRHAQNMSTDILDRYYPEDIAAGFRIFLDGAPHGPDYDAPSLAGILHHYRTFRAVAGRPNVHLFHYADMTRDLSGAMARIARALGIAHPEPVFARLVEAARFDSMKANADRFAPSAGAGVWKSDAGFFDSGTSGKWEGRLARSDLAAYDAVMDAALTPAERRWLERGDRR
jgi:aryl sulfotransferase